MNDFYMNKNQFRDGMKVELKIPTDLAFDKVPVNITLTVGS